ncbi:penicillin-binding protein 2 [Paenibacillus sp. J2TS4]|uniref:peptidoglycan D,D-transpeptidase FtsI family protein n=1 Tax=Paenibacillus sp. J2TS4 TaxID=2807194 RepID=UPI001B13E71E|nr:penicillin-binding transpeptidase domain-containing protein [Paenibacillus sp. J2TS4]GIP36639.1 penicillin-binding protein [Paenibacillus sp. J2TS4]
MNSLPDIPDLTDVDKKATRKRKLFSLRLHIYFFCAFLLFSLLIIRLALLQFVQVEEMSLMERDKLKRDITIAPIRGNIYDRVESPIASTISTQSVFYRLEPDHKLEEQIEMARKLERIFSERGHPDKGLITAEEIVLRMDVGYDIEGKETKSPSYLFWPRRIKSDLTREEVAYLYEHRDELNGLEVAEESTRMYDTKQIAVQLVGYLRPYSTINEESADYLQRYKLDPEIYVQDEYVGYDGLEYMYQDELRGRNGNKVYPVNNREQIVGEVQIIPPVKGNNLYLTIHNEVQLAAQQAIAEHLDLLQNHPPNRVYGKGSQAKAGYAVAMEVDTGKVVAMASMPGYDSNVWIGSLSNDKWAEIKQLHTNGAIRTRYANVPDDEVGEYPTSLVPPGSTLKPLTVLAGLSEGVIGPNERYYDTGLFRYGKDNNAKVSNSDGAQHGWITPQQALEVSSNTFVAELVGNRFYTQVSNPIDVWDSYMKKFGLGISTGSGLPNESHGDIYYYETAKQYKEQFPLVNGSFGQEARYTTLQLAQYASMLANKGKRYRPLFVDKMTTYDGVLIRKMEPELLDEVVLPDLYWNVVQEGMKSKVDGFDGFPYDFVRKTGTSESQVAGRPVDNALIIAYAPAEKPKLAIAVVVPDGGFGSYGAAPIARKIFDAYDQHIGLADKQD